MPPGCKPRIHVGAQGREWGSGGGGLHEEMKHVLQKKTGARAPTFPQRGHRGIAPLTHLPPTPHVECKRAPQKSVNVALGAGVPRLAMCVGCARSRQARAAATRVPKTQGGHHQWSGLREPPTPHTHQHARSVACRKDLIAQVGHKPHLYNQDVVGAQGVKGGRKRRGVSCQWNPGHKLCNHLVQHVLAAWVGSASHMHT